MYNTHAVIFDLDGTIIDSEYNYQEADRIFFRRHGIEFTEEMWKSLVGIGSLPAVKMMHEELGTHHSIDDLLAEKNEIYLEIARSRTRAFPETVKLIEMLSEAEVPLAIATGSSHPVIDVVLEIIGLRTRFLQIVSAEEVENGKPAPDVFLEAASRLGMPPQACTVVEDSQYGVEAAVVAGMRCIAIPTVVTDPLPDRFERADLLFRRGMEDFDAEKAFAWIMEKARFDAELNLAGR